MVVAPIDVIGVIVAVEVVVVQAVSGTVGVAGTLASCGCPDPFRIFFDMILSRKTWRYVYVYFDLPFLLSLKDSLADQEHVNSDAEEDVTSSPDVPETQSAADGRMPVCLPEADLARSYDVTLSDVRVKLRTIRRGNPSRPYDQLGESQGDRLGRFSFSTAEVTIDRSDLNDDPFSNNNPSPLDVFVEIAVRAINHFIEHYRVLAERPYIGPITEITIQSFRIVVEYNDGSRWPTGTGHVPGGGFELNELADDVDRQLRVRVAHRDPPPIEHTLDADIQDFMAVRDYRRAIIEVAILFEAWITSYLRERLAAGGLDSTAIDQKFSNAKGYPRSITWIAQELLKDTTGFDFAKSTEFEEWRTTVVDKRNDLVHGKSFSASWHEAYTAICAVEKARKLIMGR